MTQEQASEKVEEQTATEENARAQRAGVPRDVLASAEAAIEEALEARGLALGASEPQFARTLFETQRYGNAGFSFLIAAAYAAGAGVELEPVTRRP